MPLICSPVLPPPTPAPHQLQIFQMSLMFSSTKKIFSSVPSLSVTCLNSSKWQLFAYSSLPAFQHYADHPTLSCFTLPFPPTARCILGWNFSEDQQACNRQSPDPNWSLDAIRIWSDTIYFWFLNKLLIHAPPVLARPRECDRNKPCDLHISRGSASGCAHRAEMREGGAKKQHFNLFPPRLCYTLPFQGYASILQAFLLAETSVCFPVFSQNIPKFYKTSSISLFFLKIYR